MPAQLPTIVAAVQHLSYPENHPKPNMEAIEQLAIAAEVKRSSAAVTAALDSQRGKTKRQLDREKSMGTLTEKTACANTTQDESDTLAAERKTTAMVSAM